MSLPRKCGHVWQLLASCPGITLLISELSSPLLAKLSWPGVDGPAMGTGRRAVKGSDRVISFLQEERPSSLCSVCPIVSKQLVRYIISEIVT